MFFTEYDHSKIEAADVVIIGSGLSAVSIAERLSKANVSSVLIESGDFEYSEDADELSATYDYGPYSDGHWAAHSQRVFGGNSSYWGGYLAPFDARDFSNNNLGVDWPIEMYELTDYYEEARLFLRGGGAALHREVLENNLIYKPIGTKAALNLQYSHKEEIEKSSIINVLLGHTVTRLASHDNRTRINSFELASLNGNFQNYTLRDNQLLVLACGGIGNPRLLLQPDVRSETPVGNESGLAGRFLMEHPHTQCGKLFVAENFFPKSTKAADPYRSTDELGVFLDGIVVDDDTYKENNLIGSHFIFIPLDDPAFKKDQENFERIFDKKLALYRVNSLSEQEPDILNCVEIVGERDWAGSYRLQTHCSFNARDLRSIEKSLRIIGQKLEHDKQGVISVHNSGIYNNASGGGHILGTTRMGSDIKNSVVDRNCKVHGYNNLYIAGSSVFTTGGACNPTLTIITLSLRLADTIKKEVTGQ